MHADSLPLRGAMVARRRSRRDAWRNPERGGMVAGMLVFARHAWLCLQHAVRGSLSKAKSWSVLGLGIVAAVAAVSGYSFDFGSGNQGPAVQALIAIGAAWAVVLFVRLCLAPSRLHAQAEARIRELEAHLAKSPLEILFDAKNPSNRFCSLERTQGAQTPADIEHYHECRVEIRNSSSTKTVKNVRVIVEHIGIMPKRPMAMPFDSTQSELHDLHPQCSALAPVARWPHPKIRPGALAGASAEAYGPIAVTVSGDDVLPARKVFNFDWQRDVMIYEG